MTTVVGVRLDDGMRESLEDKMRKGNFLNLSDYLRYLLRCRMEE